MNKLTLQNFTAQFDAHGLDLNSTAILCALSGGLDSMCLLHLLHRAGANVRCVHVNHGLQSEAHSWADFCVGEASRFGYECTVHEVVVDDTANLEERCRELRHEIFASELREQELLLTAHHLDDQIETFFLQLMRGSGPTGLQAMPVMPVTFGRSRHFRPLLPWTRQALRKYGRRRGVTWHEDPTNQVVTQDRNYLRHNVLPVILERWPGALKTVNRSVALMQDANQLLRVLAALDSENCISHRSLDFAAMRDWSELRIANVIRHWLQTLGVRPPNHARLSEAVRQFLHAAVERSPQLVWTDGIIQRYREKLIFFEPCNPTDLQSTFTVAPDQWLELPPGCGRLRIVQAQVEPDDLSLRQCDPASISVGFRQTGERLARVDGTHQSLKHWFQEHGIPGELRRRIPLLRIGDKIIGVGGFWLAPEMRAAENEPAWRIEWDHANSNL